MLKFSRIFAILLLGSKLTIAQTSTNTVRFQVTYDASTQRYTVWAVPSYSTPNAFNADTVERGPTAQVSLRVPKDFNITEIIDVKGEWEKKPLKLGPNEPQQSFFNSLNPAYKYYVIGKNVGETNYGRFTKDKPTSMFQFKGNGCFGVISLLDDSDEFVKIADERASLNVKPSFYSRSGQRNLTNATPLEQFSEPIDPPASCCANNVNLGNFVFVNDRKDVCAGEKISFSLKNLKGISTQNIRFVLSPVEPINETEAYNSSLSLLGVVNNTNLTNNRTEATLSNANLPAIPGRYFVVALVDDGSGISACKPFSSARVSVNALPQVKLTSDRSGIVCKGDVVTFKVTPANQAKYEWLLEDKPLLGVMTDTHSTTTTGNYRVNVTTNSGCTAASNTIGFSTIILAQPTIRLQGDRLVCSNKTGNQWFLNNMAIPNATDSIYVPKQQGSYAVQYTTAGCKSDMSAAVLWAITAIEPSTEGGFITVYPNPVNSVAKILVPPALLGSVVQATLLDSRGRFVKLLPALVAGDNTIDVTGLTNGLYFCKLQLGTQTTVLKLVVAK